MITVSKLLITAMEAIRNITEMLFPVDLVNEWAHYYASVPLFPLFSTVHYILTACALRKEPGSLQFTFKHPIASCVMTFIVASSGFILANLALARPPLETIVNGWAVLTCLLCWYIVFLSPYDIGYSLCLTTPIQLALYIIEEFGRAKKVYSGVTMAAGVYPTSLLAMAVVGMLKGSGKRWGITWFRLIYHPTSASNHELLGISFVTKSTFTLGLIMAYYRSQDTGAVVDYTYLIVLAGIVLSAIKIFTVLSRNIDPFQIPQELTWTLLTILSFPPPNFGSGGNGKGNGQKKQVRFSSDVKTEYHKKED